MRCFWTCSWTGRAYSVVSCTLHFPYVKLLLSSSPCHALVHSKARWYTWCRKLGTSDIQATAKLTANAFPEMIFQTVQAEARNGINLSFLTHTIGLSTGCFINQKWLLDTPCSGGEGYEGWRKKPQLQIHAFSFLYKREKIAQNLRNIFQATMQL